MKFQKITSFFLAFFLFVSNIGLAMNVHYCGDEIASISINSLSNSSDSEEDCCGVVEKTSHCCKDKVVHFEKKTDQATAQLFSFMTHGSLLFFHLFQIMNAIAVRNILSNRMRHRSLSYILNIFSTIVFNVF
jgi:hypothetical protein